MNPSGFIPEMIFWNSTMPSEALRYRDGRTSGITQMPVLAFSLRAIHDASPNDLTVLQEFLPALARYVVPLTAVIASTFTLSSVLFLSFLFIVSPPPPPYTHTELLFILTSRFTLISSCALHIQSRKKCNYSVKSRYWRWWGSERNIRGKGLVSVLHGWESGLDASPLYDAAYGLKPPVGPVTKRLYLELCVCQHSSRAQCPKLNL